jgi:thioredoxin 1
MIDGADGSAIMTVTGATFDALVLQADRPTIVEFMSYGCTHCRALEPVLGQVATSLAARERTLRVNVALDAQLASDYRIRVTPTLLMFLGGREVGRLEGPRPNAASLRASVTRPFVGMPQ